MIHRKLAFKAGVLRFCKSAGYDAEDSEALANLLLMPKEEGALVVARMVINDQKQRIKQAGESLVKLAGGETLTVEEYKQMLNNYSHDDIVSQYTIVDQHGRVMGPDELSQLAASDTSALAEAEAGAAGAAGGDKELGTTVSGGGGGGGGVKQVAGDKTKVQLPKTKTKRTPGDYEKFMETGDIKGLQQAIEEDRKAGILKGEGLKAVNEYFGFAPGGGLLVHSDAATRDRNKKQLAQRFLAQRGLKYRWGQMGDMDLSQAPDAETRALGEWIGGVAGKHQQASRMFFGDRAGRRRPKGHALSGMKGVGPRVRGSSKMRTGGVLAGRGEKFKRDMPKMPARTGTADFSSNTFGEDDSVQNLVSGKMPVVGGTKPWRASGYAGEVEGLDPARTHSISYTPPKQEPISPPPTQTQTQTEARPPLASAVNKTAPGAQPVDIYPESLTSLPGWESAGAAANATNKSKAVVEDQESITNKLGGKTGEF